MTEIVLVTGVAGFIGSNLLDRLLLKTDWTVEGIDNLSTGKLANIEHNLGNNRFKFIKSNCSELNSIKKYSRIFHLAALPRIQPSFEFINEHLNANVTEGLHIIELMIKENHYPRIVYSGSSSIYGNPSQFPTSESCVINCLNPYAFQKFEFEEYLRILSTRYPINHITLRYFNPYGPRSFNPENKFNPYSSVVGIFLNQFKTGVYLTVTGDGSQRRDFIHVNDVAEANILASNKEISSGQVFNIGSGQTISILEIAKLISDKIQFIQARQGEAEVTWADISNASEKLNWYPRFSIFNYLSESISEINS